MPAIRILPDLLANKIAAGEVVERPASVVKELVENALDAGSTRILIEVKSGGRSLIQVADNGCGMSQDDALLCLERFATSKLHDDAGLSAIQTLGFRGEALPSIAAVSKLTLTTRRETDEIGVCITVEGGKIFAVQETGAPAGTLIQISNLFFNTPARRKFLKSVGTEMGHIADTVSGLALGHPQVHFNLIHNGKTVHQWHRAEDAGQRAAQILGSHAPSDLIAVKGTFKDLALNGYLAPHHSNRATSRGIYVFVNGRRVRDRVVQHALFEGYHGRLVKGRFPLAVLFLQMPFDTVDVNVHPTKHEVRFADAQIVHEAVKGAVAAALSRHEQQLWAAAPPEKTTMPQQAAEPQPEYTSSRVPFIQPPHPYKDRSLFDQLYIKKKPIVETRPEVTASLVGADDDVENDVSMPNPLSAPANQMDSNHPRFADLDIIGQFSGTYIIGSVENNLILIDQHAAHERVVFEALGRSTKRPPSQQLLLPVPVELGHAEAKALEELLPALAEMGLEIEPFGGTCFTIRSVPTVIESGDMESIVRELAEKRVAMSPESGIEKIMEESRMVMACHRAIRANRKLTNEEIRALLRQLDQCRDPGHCPHGRPTWVHWTTRDLAKKFNRIL